MSFGRRTIFFYIGHLNVSLLIISGNILIVFDVTPDYHGAKSRLTSKPASNIDLIFRFIVCYPTLDVKVSLERDFNFGILMLGKYAAGKS